jgi:predicted methyltransferase
LPAAPAPFVSRRARFVAAVRESVAAGARAEDDPPHSNGGSAVLRHTRSLVLAACLVPGVLLATSPALGAEPRNAAKPAVASADPLYLQALANPARSAADRERDAREKPADVLALADIRPGMSVADIFGGGGYYAEILSYVVGANGRVQLVNNAPYVMFTRKDYEARFQDGRLGAVQRSIVESCNLGLQPESLDAALIVMSYHDLYHYDPHGWPRIDAPQFLEQIRRAVKPGGVFVIVDHAAREGTGKDAAQDLHRIDEQFAIRDIESHGFALEKRWDGLRNAADDRTKGVFDAAIRGRTDRFVHVYRRK